MSYRSSLALLARTFLVPGLAAVGGAGLGFLLCRESWLGQATAKYGQDMWFRVRCTVRYLPQVEPWFVAGLVVVAIAMLVVWRVDRD
jgi:hypothetical protein